MSTLFAETLSRLLKPKKVLIYMLVISLVSVAVGLIIKTFYGNSILQGQIITFSSTYVMLCFFWNLGLPLALWTFYHGIGLILKEREQGTLLLLFSKPLSRSKIFWGKYLAFLLAVLLIGECSVLLSLTVMTILVFPDDKIAVHILQIIPFLMLYLLFIAVCFSSVAAGISVFCRTRKKAYRCTLFFILYIYIISPILRFLAEKPAGWTKYISYIDPSSHLSSIFHYIVTLAQDFELSPVLSVDFVGQPIIILVFWLVVSFLLLITATKKINKAVPDPTFSTASYINQKS